MANSNGIHSLRQGTVWSALRWGAALGVLAVPLVAMQFTSEVDWTAQDFLFAALVIGGAGLAYELAARTVSGHAYRAGVALAVSGAVLILWINGAVGIIGNGSNAANLLFYGMVGLGFVGTVFAMARAAAMVWVMAAMAIAQICVGIATLHLDGMVIPATIVFTAIWLGAARMFHVAARSVQDAETEA